jgi:hypothetical protein
LLNSSTEILEKHILQFCRTFRIVTSYAEDAALVDAIYFVRDGFIDGRMDLDQFEKSTKKLARRQFMVRLLIKQAREKAGLTKVSK